MSRTIILLATLLLFQTPLLTLQAVYAGEKGGLLLDRLATNILDKELVSSLTDHLRDYLVRTGKYEVFERGDAGARGAELMVGGSIVRIGDSFMVNLRISEVSTGRVIKNVKDTVGEGALLSRMEGLLNEVLGIEGIALPEIREGDGPVAEGFGFLYIKSEPSASRVLLDGDDAGATPRTLEMLKAGRYTVEVLRDGFFPWKREVFVGGGAVVNVMAELKTRHGTLKVASLPRGAEVYLDDKAVGTTPAEIGALEGGTYRLSVRLKGYEEYSDSVTITPGRTEEYSAPLMERASHKVYRLAQERRRGKQLWTWGSLAVGGLLAAKAYSDYAAADQAYSDADAAYAAYKACVPPNCDDIADLRRQVESKDSEGDDKTAEGNQALLLTGGALVLSFYHYLTLPPAVAYEETAFFDPRLREDAMIFAWTKRY